MFDHLYTAILAAAIAGGTGPPTPPAATIITKTGQTISYAAGDDGALEKGVANNFSRNSSTQIVSDSGTGLMWQDNYGEFKAWVEKANCEPHPTDPTKVGVCRDTSGDTALSYCEDLSLGGHTDWRVPVKNEMMSIIDYGNSANETSLLPAIFDSRPSVYAYMYWIAEDHFDDEGEHLNHHWFVDYATGKIVANLSKWYQIRVRCVRGTAFPRDNSNDIVTATGVATDLSTGLMWMDTSEFLNSNRRMGHADALVRCNTSTHAGHSDWRLPNVNEWLSFIDYNNEYESPVKKGVAYRPYCPGGAWTSTTAMSKNYTNGNEVATVNGRKYAIHLGYGTVSTGYQSNGFARCVRDAD